MRNSTHFEMEVDFHHRVPPELP